ncbi:tyrosine-type recombinase/integrase [Desulfatiglans anilini]|uniref:tyrosine-type recombinase/integrase n=1 Tax=Desulfatiglans anilini TaxID=90728 RepID=UPI0004263F08|nr:site-specific integrase [Desulfatiglans anilini]
MPVKERFTTKYPGVFYVEGTGRDGQPERIYYYVFRKDGKQFEEKAGRAREDAMTPAKAARIRAERIEGKRKSRKEVREAKKKRPLTFRDLFQKHYFPHSQATKRNAQSWRREDALFRLWVDPVIGSKALPDVSAFHLERIKSDMAKAGRAPRSVHYALALVRQVYNYAKTHDFYNGESPISKVKKPSIQDNRRMRYLTKGEAESLLDELAKKSTDVHDMALVSLHTGLRAGEIFSLQWGDVDISRGTVAIKDTKSGRNRVVFMTDRVKAMFESRWEGAPTDLVFPGREGKKIVQMSDTFNRVVATLGFNQGIEDPRQRVCFHTCRHSHASWLVEQGTDLYTVKELLGHANFSMTSRYSHLGENVLQGAIKRLNETLEPDTKTGKLVSLKK